MPIFTDPVSLNDGVAARSFSWLQQVPGLNAALYYEPLAPVTENSKIQTAHQTQKGNRKRHLLQRVANCTLTVADGDKTMDSIIVNVSVTHHANAAVADIEKQIKLATAAFAIAGFPGKLINGVL